MVKTLYYGFIIRAKLSLYTRKKRKSKKIFQAVLTEKLSKEKLDAKTIEKISTNYLNIGEIFMDRKNLKSAFSLNMIYEKRRNNSKN